MIDHSCTHSHNSDTSCETLTQALSLLQVQAHQDKLSLVLALALSGLTTLPVVGLKYDWQIVEPITLALITVTTMKTLVPDAYLPSVSYC